MPLPSEADGPTDEHLDIQDDPMLLPRDDEILPPPLQAAELTEERRALQPGVRLTLETPRQFPISFPDRLDENTWIRRS